MLIFIYGFKNPLIVDGVRQINVFSNYERHDVFLDQSMCMMIMNYYCQYCDKLSSRRPCKPLVVKLNHFFIALWYDSIVEFVSCPAWEILLTPFLHIPAPHIIEVTLLTTRYLTSNPWNFKYIIPYHYKLSHCKMLIPTIITIQSLKFVWNTSMLCRSQSNS